MSSEWCTCFLVFCCCRFEMFLLVIFLELDRFFLGRGRSGVFVLFIVEGIFRLGGLI